MKRFSLKSLTPNEITSFAQDFAKIHAKYVATNSTRGSWLFYNHRLLCYCRIQLRKHGFKHFKSGYSTYLPAAMEYLEFAK